MKPIKKLSVILLSFTLLFSACQSVQVDTPPVETDASNPVEDVSPWNVSSVVKFEESNFSLAGFVNDKVGILMGHHGAIHFTNDGGQTWPVAKDADTHFTPGLDFIDEKTAYCCGDFGSICVTNDSGATWTKLPEYDPLDQNPYQFISFSDKNNGWVATTSKLGYTTDGGQNWTTVKLPGEIQFITAIWQRSKSSGYILDNEGNLYLTNDNGKTFEKKSLGLVDEKIPGLPPAQVAVIKFSDEDNGLVIFFNKDMKLMAMRTSDGGDSWKDEKMPDIKYGYLYLTRDLKTLSVSNPTDKIITVLKYNK